MKMVRHETKGEKGNFFVKNFLLSPRLIFWSRREIFFQKENEGFEILPRLENFPFIDTAIVKVIKGVFGVAFDGIFGRHKNIIRQGTVPVKGQSLLLGCNWRRILVGLRLTNYLLVYYGGSGDNQYSAKRNWSASGRLVYS